MPACGSCGAPIEWALTAKRKRIPLDPQRGDGIGNLREAGRLTDGTLVVASMSPGEGNRVSHFASCPNASAHRQTAQARRTGR